MTPAYVVVGGVSLPFEVARLVEWAGVDVAADLARVCRGEVKREDLLRECLEGSARGHGGEWREYVSCLWTAAIRRLETPE